MEKKEILEALQAQLAEFRKGVITPEQMADAIKSVEAAIEKSATVEQLDDVKATIDEMKTALKELRNTTDKRNAEEVKSGFGEKIAGKIAERVKQDAGAKFKGTYAMKAVAPVTLSGVTVATPAPVLSTIVDAEVFRINRNQGADIMDYVNVATTDRATIVYVEEVEGEGAAGKTAEGAAKNATDVKFAERVSNADKYTAYVKISDEMLDDTPRLAAAVEEITGEKVARKVRSAVVEAALASATAFDLTDYDGAVPMANMADAIHAALVQSEGSGFVPSVLLINPKDFGALRFLKSTDGTPIISYYGEGRFPVFSESLAIVKRTDVPAGTFLVGDLNAVKVRYYRQSVELGYSDDDFIKNLRTLIAEIRAHIYVPANEAASLVKGEFDTIVEQINAAE